MILALALWAPVALAEEPAANACKDPAASEAFVKGFRMMKLSAPKEALTAYQACLSAEPSCVACQYEVGWAWWASGDYASAATAWEKTLALDPGHGAAKQWLASAQAKTGGGSATSGGGDVPTPGGLRVPIGTKSTEAGPVSLELVARFQNYNPKPTHPNDHYDTDVYSPKSARFSADGAKVYVNSLEGYTTPVYDTRTFTKIGTIAHDFDAADDPLFRGETTVFGYPYHDASPDGNVNHFRGKPVESALSHQGRYLWVPYYRRDYDDDASSPSAVSVIDTQTDQIVRVFPTGPLPKYVAISPDGRWAAVVHWGDNTVGLIDIRGGDVGAWKYRPERLVVEYALDMNALSGKSRDAECGMCLRGAVFTPDSKVLLVARMGNGGIAGFDVDSGRYLGTTVGEKPTPRHLVLSPDGQTLYMTNNTAGMVSKIPLSTVVSALQTAAGKKVTITGYQTVAVGGQARTLEISPDGRWLFAASKGRAELVVVDAAAMSVVARVRTDSYTVGLDVAPDGSQVWTTSQGTGSQGGNSVCVYRVTVK